MKFTTSVISLSLLALATIGVVDAMASDIPIKVRQRHSPVIVAYNWSGIYIGVNGGVGIGATGGATSNPLSVLVPNDPADKMKGWLFGGQIGARQQVGAWVFGVQGDIDWTNISNRSTSSNTVRRTFFSTQLADTTSSQTNGAKIDYLSTVTGSVGVTPWDRVLWSLQGGLAFAKVSWDNRQNVSTSTLSPTGTAFCNAGAISCPNGSGAASDSKVKWGWTLGTVLEIALNQNWSTKGEVDYVSLGSTGNAMGSQKFDLWIAKGGFNYRF